MAAQAPISTTTRLTMFGQVSVFAWVLPAFVIGWALQGSLGHVSGVVLFPLGWQILLGILIHGTLLFIGHQRLIASLPVCLCAGIVVTLLVGLKTLIQSAPIADYGPFVRVLVILLLVSLISSALSWFLARREMRNPSLG